MEDFDKFADNYKKVLDDSLKIGGENGLYFTEYKANCINRIVGENFKGKILDYGCGIGLLSEVLVSFFTQSSINGFDVSKASIAHIPPLLKDKGFFTSDHEKLSSDYDLIVMANVMHHIEPPERAAVINKLASLLKRNGKIVIFEHNPINPVTRKIVRESPLDTGVVLLPWQETCGYLKNAGFKNFKRKYIVFFPKFLSALRVTEPFLWWLPFGAQYLVVGEV